MATVYERVKKIIVEQLGVDEAEVQPNASFVEDLNADSLDLVELVMSMEEEFSKDGKSVQISDEDAEKLVTVQDCETPASRTSKPSPSNRIAQKESGPNGPLFLLRRWGA